MPRQREPKEQQLPISLTNLVINNVNHLKELLITLDISHLGFFQLTLAFKSFKLPTIIMKYIDEKGAVASERMIKLRDGQNPQKRFSEIAPFVQMSPMDL